MKKNKKQKNYLGSFDLDELKYLKPNAKPYTVISLFSGAGGFDIGTSQAGFQTRVMVEWEKAACDTLRANFTMEGHQKVIDRYLADAYKEKKQDKKYIARLKRWRERGPTKVKDSKLGWYHKPEPAILCEDITKLSTARILEAARLRIGECTLLTGGFPCQGFSMANSVRDKDNYKYDKRNFLYLECVRVIREALPKTFCLENVPGLISMEKGAVVKMICKDLAAVGYNITWYKLNAADYGVPQNRIRVFFFGHRNDLAVFKNKNRQQLYLGGVPGTVTHPDWFIEKYGA